MIHSLSLSLSLQAQILEIITLRKQGLRGQAWVIFASVSTATAALQAEQNFTFFGKPLKINYANEKSDRIAKKDGTYVPKDRRKKRLLEGQAQGQGGGNGAIEDGSSSKKLKLENDADGNKGGEQVEDPSILVPDTTTTTNRQSSSSSTTQISPPSNILFAETLPKDCNEMMLACLFRSYQGYKEVRIPRTGLAFIEFDDEPHASVALKALNGFQLSESETLNLKYGKA